MPCPDCGCSAGEFRSTDSVETHGLDCGPYEYFHEEYVICLGCDECFDVAEWSAAAEPDTDVNLGSGASVRDDPPIVQGTFDAEDYATPSA
jgi:hypothetical protein